MRQLPLISKIILAAIALMSAVQLFQTVRNLAAIYPVKKPAAFAFAGTKFDGMQVFFKGERYIGYYTDLGMDNPRANMELLQAQHTLTPYILDPTSINHKYVIVNCQDIPGAIKKFQALGATPLTRVNAGIFIVEMPKERS